MLNDNQRKFLLRLARESILAHLEDRPLNIKQPPDKEFNEKRGVFVSLHIDDALRGCIGYIKPYFTLFESVRELAIAAAFNDPRFSHLDYDELESSEIEISILSEMIPVDRNNLDEVQIGRDGLYIVGSYGNGLLLPQVAVDEEWNRETFLRHVSLKAGLPPKSYLSEAYNLFRFTAEVFSE